MAARNPELRTRTGQVTAALRWGTENDVISAKRNLHEARLRILVEREIAKWPPLSAEQRARIAALLTPEIQGARAA